MQIIRADFEKVCWEVGWRYEAVAGGHAMQGLGAFRMDASILLIYEWSSREERLDAVGKR